MTTFREALGGVPRIDEAEWAALSPLKRWLVASRAAVLVMTLLSAVLAGILGWRDGHFSWGRFVALSVGLMAAHAANNLLNDLTDHLTGADRGDSFRNRYGTQPLEVGLMSTRQNLTYAAVTGTVALAAGAYLTWLEGTAVVLLAGLGALFLLAYTWPLKHIGLGELSALIVWGPLMIGGGYLALGGGWSWGVVLAGLPYALGVTAVLVAKHIDKADNDRERGIHTLPVVVGKRPARALVLVMVAAQYTIAAGLVASGPLGWPVLACLAAVPLLRYLVPVFSRDAPDSPPEGYPASAWPLWFVSFAFVHNRRFGALYVVGLLAEAALIRL